MGNVGALEGIVNKLLTPIRISPAGALCLVTGPALFAGGGILEIINGSVLVRLVGGIMAPSGLGMTVYGILMYE